MKVAFHPEAARELLEAPAWYRERSAVAAVPFAGEVSAAIERIEDRPGSWKRYLQGSRRVSLSNFPFSIIYRERREDIEIIAVAHHRRRPGYWTER